MWWWLEKLEDTDETAIYAYGVATQNATGRILISKVDNEITRIKMADEDNEPLYAVFAGFVRSIIAKAGYPQIRSIATG